MGIRRIIDSRANRTLPDMPACDLTLEDRLALVRQYGASPLSMTAAIQNGLSHFGDERGFIAYKTKAGSLIVLSDPICDKKHLEALIADFLCHTPRASFAQIKKSTANVLQSLNYKTIALGPDFVMDFDGYDFSGKRLQTVRASHKWLLKRGYTFEELHPGQFDAIEINAFAKSFRAAKTSAKREMSFLNPPLDLENDFGIRRFSLREPDGRIGAFIELHPMWRHGRIFGYSIIVKRRRPGTTNHAEIGLTKHIGDKLRSEKIEQLALGLAPFFEMENAAIRDAGGGGKLARFLAEHSIVNKKVFNFQGHGKFKRRFHGREEMTYFAWRGRPFLREIIALTRMSKMI